MLLGIISDSHDNLQKIDAAVAKMNSLRVDQVLHGSDYCAPFAELRYKDLKAKMYGVFGNNDAEKDLLKQQFESLGHKVNSHFAMLESDKVKIALLRGDEPELLQFVTPADIFDLGARTVRNSHETFN